MNDNKPSNYIKVKLDLYPHPTQKAILGIKNLNMRVKVLNSLDRI